MVNIALVKDGGRLTGQSVRKRNRQNEVRNLRNRAYRSQFRTSIKKLLKAMLTITNPAKNVVPASLEDVRGLFESAKVMIDKTQGKGLIHKNKAARLKSRLSVRVKELSNQLSSSANA